MPKPPIPRRHGKPVVFKYTNCYLDLSKLKAELGITDTANDAQLLRLLNRASRFIDNYCQRHFYALTETKKWRTEPGYWHSVPDLYTATLVTLDTVTLTEDTDYELEPRYGYPKITFRMLKAAFTTRQAFEIAGIWCYEHLVADSGATVQDDPNLGIAVTTVTLSDDTYLSIAQTLLIEDEQVFVTGLNVVTHTATIVRAVNGTDAAVHAQGKPIDIIVYPDPIEQACFIQALRWYRGRDAAWGDEVGIEGKMKYGMEPHPSVRVLLNPYRRITGGF